MSTATHLFRYRVVQYIGLCRYRTTRSGVYSSYRHSEHWTQGPAAQLILQLPGRLVNFPVSIVVLLRNICCSYSTCPLAFVSGQSNLVKELRSGQQCLLLFHPIAARACTEHQSVHGGVTEYKINYVPNLYTTGVKESTRWRGPRTLGYRALCFR